MKRRRGNAVAGWAIFCGVLAIGACGPRLGPLQGIAPANGVLPVILLPPQPHQVVFTWDLEQNSLVARGTGAARLTAPDSARVDFFLAGGFGSGGSAILIGDSVVLPDGGEVFRHMIPPAPILWAVLGRLTLPPLPDTVIRLSGDTLRADLGHPTQWRVTAVHNQLARLDHVSGRRIVEWVERTGDGGVRYGSSDRRSLVLHIQRDLPMAAFDASIWHF